MAWYNPSWQYRQSVTISGSTGAGTNYQVPLNIGESSGATGYNFQLNGHSAKFPSDKNDGGDLRFTASDGTTLLNFWVESVTGTSPNRVAKVWVQVSADLGSNQTIYCYYGNANAINASNGFNTFIFFDNFDDYTTTSVTEKGRWAVGVDSVFSIDTTNHRLYINNPSGSFGHWIKAQSGGSDVVITNCAIETNIYNNGGYNECAIMARGQADPVANSYDFHETTWASPYWVISKRSGSTSSTVASSTTSAVTGQWMHWTIKLNGSTLSWVSDVGLTTAISVSDSTFSSGIVGVFTWGNTVSYIDDYRIRKYVSPEPAFSSAGSEENAQQVLTSFFLFFNN